MSDSSAKVVDTKGECVDEKPKEDESKVSRISSGKCRQRNSNSQPEEMRLRQVCVRQRARREGLLHAVLLGLPRGQGEGHCIRLVEDGSKEGHLRALWGTLWGTLNP